MYKRLLVEDINSYFMNICTEIQNHAVSNKSRDLFRKIRAISRKFKPSHWAVKDENDHLVTELGKIRSVWKNYWESLYAGPKFIVEGLGNFEKEPDILLEEVEVAIHKLRESKSMGFDRISAEVPKPL